MAAGAGGMAGVQALTDMASSGLGAYFANRETNQAWSRQKAMMTRRYQWTMMDMKKAGLNPILAYQQGGTGGAAVPQSSQPSVKTSDYAASAREGALIGAQLRNLEANTTKTLAEAEGVGSMNEQREFYGKLWSKANELVDGLLKRFGPATEKLGANALEALEAPKAKVHSGKSASEFKGEYVKPGLMWDAGSQRWVPSREPGYKFEGRTKGGYYEDWK